MQKIELPKGEWAQLLDADEISEKARRALMGAQSRMIKAVDLEQGEDGEIKADVNSVAASLDMFADFKDALIMCHLKSWSFDNLPIQMDSLQEIPAMTYDALHDAAQTISKGLHLSVDPADAADPESPTASLAG